MRISILTLVLVVSACGDPTAVPPGNKAPVAALECPDHADLNESFHVSGAGSKDLDGKVTNPTVQIADLPAVEGLEADGAFSTDRIVVAVLAISDDKGAAAKAVCRIVIGNGVPADPTEGEGEGDEGEGEEPPPPQTGDPVDLNGTFAMISYDHGQLDSLALNPSSQCQSEPVLSLVHVTQDGTSITHTSEVCSLSFATVTTWFGEAETFLPDGFINAINNASRSTVSFVMPAALTGQLYAPPPPPDIVVGAHGISAGGALPTSDDDPSVDDGDGDSNPGVTIENTFGEQWIVYRRHVVQQHGIVASSNEVDGTTPGSFQVDSESSLLNLLDLFVPAAAGLPSSFKMTRVDGTNGTTDISTMDGVAGLTCADVRAYQATLESMLPRPTCH